MNIEPKIIKISETPDHVIFDLLNVDVSIANGLRRIMISEVPTMAIERVLLEDNTSSIPDEMLCHRLGLIPINADPRKFNFPKDRQLSDATEEDTIVFNLDVECTLDSVNNPVNDKVYSSHLIWEPQGEQEETFREKPIKPVLDDILIAELQPGQKIKCQLYCCKGIGQDHAKFSPVCTAAYRMMPKITISQLNDTLKNKETKKNGDKNEMKKRNEMKKEIKNCCPLNVFDIENGDLIVKNPRNCKMCRECIRDERSEYIQLGREENHYIFSVESTGVYEAKEIFVEAIKIMKNKGQHCLEILQKRKHSLND